MRENSKRLILESEVSSYIMPAIAEIWRVITSTLFNFKVVTTLELNFNSFDVRNTRNSFTPKMNCEFVITRVI